MWVNDRFSSSFQLEKQRGVRVASTYQDSFEVDDCLVCLFVMVKNCVCKLRDIMTSIALPSNVEIPGLIFRKPFQPIHQEQIIICSCFLIPIGLIIRWCVWVRKSYPNRWFQEQNICSFKIQLSYKWETWNDDFFSNSNKEKREFNF